LAPTVTVEHDDVSVHAARPQCAAACNKERTDRTFENLHFVSRNHTAALAVNNNPENIQNAS
jgi:hypothetical protein